MADATLIQEAIKQTLLKFPPTHCLHCGTEVQWAKSGQLVFYDAGAVYICYTCGTEHVDKVDTLTIVIPKGGMWIETLSTNQADLAKKNRNLRIRVGSLETRCTLQDAEIALLDARMAQACGGGYAKNLSRASGRR